MSAPVVVRLFSDLDGVTVELFGLIAGMERAEFSARFPGIQGRRFDSKRMQVAKSTDGRILPVTRAIKFKKVKVLHRCNPACLDARGPNCECACGGVNHGRGDAGAQSGMFDDTFTPVQSGFTEDKNARVEAVAADFALEFMGGALDLGGEQMDLGGIGGGGGDLPRRAPDSKQITMF